MQDYDFSSLSPYDFEVLSQDALGAYLGVTLHGFRSGRDLGVDLRYSGDGSSIVVQCKHYLKSTFKALLRTMVEECDKVASLKPDRYILVTSQDLSVGQVDALFEALQPYCRSKGDILGKATLNAIIRANPWIETNHFKLWLGSTQVMERILHRAVINQSELENQRIVEKIALFVPTDKLERAEKVLHDHHTCVLAGIPGIGKTTLAQILCAKYIAEGWQVITIGGNLREGLELLKLSPDARQVLYYDDFLGQVSRGDHFAKNEEHLLLHMMEFIRKSPNKRLILTSREYILAQAKQKYEVLHHSSPMIDSCLVRIEDYSLDDKARILANHLFFRDVPQEYIDALLDSGVKDILLHENYSPRVVEWMTDLFRIRAIPCQSYAKSFREILDNPKDLWGHAFDNVAESSRNLLLILATCGAKCKESVLRKAFHAFHLNRGRKYNQTTTPYDFMRSLEELEGNFIRIGIDRTIDFHNPSVRDFLSNFLRQDLDTAADILDSALYFEQVISVERCLTRPQTGPKLLEPIRSIKSSMEDAIMRTLSSPSCIAIFFGSWGSTADSYPEYDRLDRLDFTLEMAATLESDVLCRFCESHCDEFFKSLGEYSFAHFELVPLLDTLDSVRKYFSDDKLDVWKKMAVPVLLQDHQDLLFLSYVCERISLDLHLIPKSDLREFKRKIRQSVSAYFGSADAQIKTSVLSTINDLLCIEKYLDLDFPEITAYFERNHDLVDCCVDEEKSLDPLREDDPAHLNSIFDSFRQ